MPGAWRAGPRAAGPRSTRPARCSPRSRPTCPATTASAAAPVVGQGVSLSGAVADGNAAACSASSVAPIAYAWTLQPPAGSSALLRNATSAAAGFTPDVAGRYSYSLTATDALGYSA